MNLYAFMGAIETGLAFALVALGSYLTFKVLNFPDLTVEGSFPLGASVCATLISAGVDPWLATAAAAAAGFLAGATTAFLNLRFRILHILAGILTAIALYSVNLRIMGRPNTPLLGSDTVFSIMSGLDMPSIYSTSLFLAVVVAVAVVVLDLFLATGHGLAMRAVGANPRMARANGVNVERTILLGLGIANCLTALSGALFAQMLGAADVSMGIGVIVIGLASVIGGMSLLPSRTVALATVACVVGSVLYRLAIAVALNAGFIGLTASDVNIVTAVLVTIALIAPGTGFTIKALRSRRGGA